MWSRGVPRHEASLLPLITPLARRLVRAAYKITPESAQRSLERVRGVFRQVDQRLSDGRRFLAGERFTAADLTFAALAAPVLFPVEYRAVHPPLDTMSAAMRIRFEPAGHRRRAVRAAVVFAGAWRFIRRGSVSSCMKVRPNMHRRECTMRIHRHTCAALGEANER